ncbi:unnamed protein product [Polarella glacialis]|uniref:Protein kinase domain-containing protein n=1 Tax=Polarella glacialis TaxID=89957 RepID=A0A813FFQ0_POLGL|nr:unnamed protein product [Polarella glacialis]|mmetsp:Transcript_71048/g.114603  ORF Transcript_71048/g.114603 Transcript_71048/m.114603 type:complete len:395 (-) Transcript_71048:23-1207(-)
MSKPTRSLSDSTRYSVSTTPVSSFAENIELCESGGIVANAGYGSAEVIEFTAVELASSTSSPSLGPSVMGEEKRKAGLRDRIGLKLSVDTDGLPRPAVPNDKAFFRVVKEGESVHDFYEFAEQIYCAGAKGKVIMAKRKSDGAEVVLKIRTKRENRGGERNWREIMKQLCGLQGSDHVLDINEILEDDLAFYVIMPRCNGGELFQFLVTETEVPEAECKRIIREILIAVGTLHKQGLVHRDIKPENIMFNQVDLAAATPKSVKLIDFDTCVEWTPASPKSNRFVGTPGYIAPEALMGQITPKSDLWSVGVILYILMTGETPWSSLVSLEDGTVGSAGAKKMYTSLKNEVFEWETEPWPDFPLARDMCQKLLAFHPEDRPDSVQEVLDHAWLSGT